MKRLPMGIQTFSKLRDPADDYVYVDKTEPLLRLAETGGYYFLTGKTITLVGIDFDSREKNIAAFEREQI